MTNMHDNSFEIDGSMHNIRVMRNLMINSASHPFCNQPSIGGPVYWVRNIAYNAPFGSVRMSSGAPGVWFINNTIFSEFNAPTSANLHMFNNLILGENAITENDVKEEDHPPILQVNTYTSYSESDYNGFRPNPGAKVAFEWNSPAPGMMQDYRELTGSIDGSGPATDPIPNSLAKHQYATLADYSAGTHNDQHSVVVDYAFDFMNVKQLDARDIKTLQKLYKAEDFDFRLKPGFRAGGQRQGHPQRHRRISPARRPILAPWRQACLFPIMVRVRKRRRRSRLPGEGAGKRGRFRAAKCTARPR